MKADLSRTELKRLLDVPVIPMSGAPEIVALRDPHWTEREIARAEDALRGSDDLRVVQKNIAPTPRERTSNITPDRTEPVPPGLSPPVGPPTEQTSDSALRGRDDLRVVQNNISPTPAERTSNTAVRGRDDLRVVQNNISPTPAERTSNIIPDRTEPVPPGAARRDVGWLLVPTGGTSGTVRFARHDEATLCAAVRGFTQHFGLTRVNALGTLPLHHVSGLMARVRAAATGGDYLAADWKQIESGQRPKLPARDDGWVTSLVPTQLERLLRQPAAVEWLRGFRIIFLGGAPAWPALLDRAAEAGLALALSYGMTETAAMVTALRPEEFARGARDCGTVLPHASVAITAEGVIRVAGESVFRGYWPELRDERHFDTADLGLIDADGHLHVLGRRDEVIITGGEKVNPREVEAVLRATGEFADIAVFGQPHPEWGAAVCAAYPAERAPDSAKVRAAVERDLVPWKRPKEYVALADWPRTAAGKINRAELAARVTRETRESPRRK